MGIHSLPSSRLAILASTCSMPLDSGKRTRWILLQTLFTISSNILPHHLRYSWAEGARYVVCALLSETPTRRFWNVDNIRSYVDLADARHGTPGVRLLLMLVCRQKGQLEASVKSRRGQGTAESYHICTCGKVPRLPRICMTYAVNPKYPRNGNRSQSTAPISWIERVEGFCRCR